MIVPFQRADRQAGLAVVAPAVEIVAQQVPVPVLQHAAICWADETAFGLHALAGDWEKAIKECSTVLERNAGNVQTRLLVIANHAHKGDADIMRSRAKGRKKAFKSCSG